MDVFGFAVAAGGEFLRDAAIDAAYELGVLDALARADGPRSVDQLADAAGLGRGRRRLRPLLDVLAALGVIARAGAGFVAAAAPPPRPVVTRAHWGLMAEVLRRDRALPVEGGDTERRFHRHLATAGAAAARELAPLLGPGPLVDLGGGAGAYTAAFLDAQPAARATLCDFHDVLALAAEHLGPLRPRVRMVGGDASVAPVGDDHGVALLCNVLHLHGPRHAAALCAAAARAVVPGGLVVIKDLRVDEDRSGPLAGLLFALNMAIYTGEGDVYPVSQLRRWLADAGVVAVTEHQLAAAPDAVVLIGRRAAPT